MARFEQLRVWHEARELLKAVHQATRGMKGEGDLVSQMRRAGISVASNIAEGAQRGNREFIRFLRIADGSAAELRAQAMIGLDFGLIDELRANSIIDRTRIIGRMIYRLMASMDSGGG